MQRLAEYPAIIYDTNCIIYYCFYVEVLVESKPTIVSERLTQHTRSVTEEIKRNGQKVTTIQEAYNQLRNAIAGAVDRRMSHREVEAQLGLKQGHKIPEQMKLRVTQSVEKHARKLETSSWFIVNTTFVSDQNALQALRQFYNTKHVQAPASFGGSSIPDHVDLKLINFGFQIRYPLVTNDGGIHRFAIELLNAGLAFLIFPLTDIQVAPSTGIT